MVAKDKLLPYSHFYQNKAIFVESYLNFRQKTVLRISRKSFSRTGQTSRARSWPFFVSSLLLKQVTFALYKARVLWADRINTSGNSVIPWRIKHFPETNSRKLRKVQINTLTGLVFVKIRNINLARCSQRNHSCSELGFLCIFSAVVCSLPSEVIFWLFLSIEGRRPVS